MKELEKPETVKIINGYIQPSQVFILDNGKFDDYAIELIVGYNIGYIIRAQGAYPYKNDVYKCYNDFEVFKSVYSLGKKLTDILYPTLLKSNKNKYVYANSIFSNKVFVIDLSVKEIENIKPIILDWLEKNGMLFRSEREYVEELDNYYFSELVIFIDKCITIYTFYTYIELTKEKEYYGKFSETEKNIFDKLSELFNNITVDYLFRCMLHIEENSPEINVQDRLVAFTNNDNEIKYRIVKYFSNILSGAWYKMKLLICEDIENSHYRTCRKCNTPYEITGNNQKFCEHCKETRIKEKYSRRYRKILELHQELIQTYKQSNRKDEQIENIVNLKLKADILKIGIQKHIELLEKLHSL